MTTPSFAPIRPANLDWQDSTPVATDYNDPYFSRQDGMAESRYVFLEGNRLADRFRTMAPDQYFVIGETGFGTGLNCLLAAQLFLAQAPKGARLHLVSVEKHPLRPEDLQTALAHWPELAPLAASLLAEYPAPAPGQHRLELHPAISLTLLYGEAEQLWRLFNHPMDAWFLDGFAPACNPDMWQPAVFAELARLSRPGTTLATFTAAGFVRRGLQEAGFQMEKRNGFGHKRHMLTGTMNTASPARQQARPSILVVGAGLAGATTARALAERGCQVTVTDPDGVASQASGNLAGVVYSTPSAHLTPQNRFYQQSYDHALRWLKRHQFPDQPDQGRLNGVIQHFVDDKQKDKLNQAMETGAWPEAQLRAAGNQAVELVGGGYIQPAVWCRQLLEHPNITLIQSTVTGVQEGNPAIAHCADGRHLSADAIVLCTAGSTARLPGLEWLPLKHIRGQVSYCRATEASSRWEKARCHGGYLTPALSGLHCVGATFNLHNPDPAPCDSDDAENLAQLKNYLPEYWQQLGGDHIEIVERRVAFRCQSIDFLPLCGPLPVAAENPHRSAAGIYLNVAHGSRGITGTPLCADLLADLICNSPLPVDQQLVDALAPERFIVRKRRKQPEWKP
ncbi:bifunctional tRNA (5-methylaminomethyl-2-thiouridine)(34)-methyltransferase MnmD/FAD-dependent 5-carboxymethylaminomethyl-2-thiouridine(34) oxidoreductase MnmC [Alcanivorax sp. DP30]|uniref:bifunctional tRNA (5-methylaminomethyl-2-thiouridine)(34)-methyltransferase MnmD/FAD-dependent 5-carboxymethylaminomethyl-2-thiouridine(34) oxidoreductase MnmC n=1 Tax=Alcanivorax sp. DP30 TaxID=2606217 RepID=UPI00136CBA45|nr:bifunctional tRNA (5-methylaminomethyl-2-thiouridine)(34)-methyltransferase MnmD/FAD-dependent 5-carboxymethylaminomethyl-2-thiouridine(34) oxidoreductase MnmC [Alcanivorax sp. DP30]MZR62115.1 bifunctional tRNA (5-methylaminomethyl-2-thiouridine)(34)-methyltransferase MnmD/FAD-dependent 5-carboxymethylaminomethyl-2-thiouridine(34) oxidoreductase MnmC [Alcanivorax sp. DP30]